MCEHIKDMASRLIEAGLATDGEQVKLVLAAYWADKTAFSRIIAIAPKNSPQLLTLLELLPEAEKDLLNTAFSILFVLGQGEMEYLSAEQKELAKSILRLTCLET